MDTSVATAGGSGSSANATGDLSFLGGRVKLAPEGWFQVGEGPTHFVLTVTLAFAQDLDVLLAAAGVTPRTGVEPAYLYYTFLANDVATAPFYRLRDPDFPAERTFVRFRSSAEELAEFFNEQATINVFACLGTETLGFAEVDLTAALLVPDGGAGAGQLRRNTVTEGVCPFVTATGRAVTPADGGRAPVLGVSLSLVREVDVTSPLEALMTSEPAAFTEPATAPPAPPPAPAPVPAPAPAFAPASAAAPAPALAQAPVVAPAPTAPAAAPALATEHAPTVAPAPASAPGQAAGPPAAPAPAAAAAEPPEGADWREIFRQSDEYRVALQLEIWRHEEELKFKQDLDERMAEEEWQRREREREAMVVRIQAQLHEEQQRVRRREEELDRLERALLAGRTPGVPAPLASQPAAPVTSNPTVQAQIRHLIQKRASMLRSGVYSPHDALIRQLDERINQLLIHGTFDGSVPLSQRPLGPMASA